MPPGLAGVSSVVVAEARLLAAFGSPAPGALPAAVVSVWLQITAMFVTTPGTVPRRTRVIVALCPVARAPSWHVSVVDPGARAAGGGN